MYRFNRFARELGASLGAAAEDTELQLIATSFGVNLPTSFCDLYRTSNGLQINDGEFNILTLEEMARYAGRFPCTLGYVPFTESNDSNPYAICCAEPLRGYIAHIYHDDVSVLVCDSIERFLRLLAERRRALAAMADDELDDEPLMLSEIAGDLAIDVPERGPQDRRSARALVALVANVDRDHVDRNTMLHYAVQLFGAGNEAELGQLLTTCDEYVREWILRRCRALKTPLANQIIDLDQADYHDFVANLDKSLQAEGLKTQWQNQHGLQLTVQPGAIHLNLPMLYGERGTTDFLPDLVARIRRWQSERSP